MKFSFPMPGGGSGVALFSKLIRTKDLRKMQADDQHSSKPKLTVVAWNGPPHYTGGSSLYRCAAMNNSVYNFLQQKCLTTLDLTSLGVGSCCGTGMYLVAGMVARNIAGPGVILSFIIAALASIFSGKNQFPIKVLLGIQLVQTGGMQGLKLYTSTEYE